MSKITMHETTSRIKVENREELIELLNQQLANLSDLYSQTKFAHWNVKGANFIAVHKLFDKLAEEVEDAIDEVAERAAALGGLAKGTSRMVAEFSQLGEFPEGTTDCMSVLEVVSEAYANVGNRMREAVTQADELKDANTTDLLTQVSRMLDESLYFLESHGV
ncbi:DNA starvation/stationary phase protection protein Dps [Telmatocola sphagniphila]|uniref:DNA starvation/stationary phase protection protein Dps n=1 Tax=Telmatocola sphagniphila TaxID=1123043 RepID=A0A8E6BA25_9BACT|nr:DNA starvation/stationary phase protection protein Dps [Telmatocola sphagniphila]QVL34573.1 DNA starvation/stationary phase protection protein Dps [Telmatocola sphagniphila]